MIMRTSNQLLNNTNESLLFEHHEAQEQQQFNKHHHRDHHAQQQSKQRIEEDRSAIRQALAILEQEGVQIVLSNKQSNIAAPELQQHRPRHPRRRTRAAMTKKNKTKVGGTRTKEEDDVVEVDSNNKSKRTRTNTKSHHKSKTVHFATHDDIKAIRHTADMTQEEIDQCWMKEEDFTHIRSRSLKLINMMDKGRRRNTSATTPCGKESQQRQPYSICLDTNTMIVNNHLVCIRGLERSTDHSSSARQEHQHKVQTAVFRVQQQQRQHQQQHGGDHHHGEEAIRDACLHYSKRSLKEARLIGISDQINATTASKTKENRQSRLKQMSLPLPKMMMRQDIQSILSHDEQLHQEVDRILATL